MICVPAMLSVAGPVTAAGSMPNCSREHPHAPPGRHRIVGRQHDGGEGGADPLVLEDRRHAVGPQQAVAQLGHDGVRAGRGPGEAGRPACG